MDEKKLLAVGYWRSLPEWHDETNDDFPDPTLLVDEDWHAANRARIVGYLRAGEEYIVWRGFSYCRFDCGMEFSKMGSRCFTDGVWVWPQGLAHYVDVHHIRLPEEFVAHMARQSWAAPLSDYPMLKRDRSEYDYSFWIAWGKSQQGAADAPIA